jgi:DNA-binding HxlR family transcriptional regulator
VTYGITDRMKDIEKVLAQLEGLGRKWHGEGATARRESSATA